MLRKMLAYFNSLETIVPKKQIDRRVVRQLLEKNLPGTARDYTFTVDTTTLDHLELFQLIVKYNEIITVPKRINFLSKKTTCSNEAELAALEREFWHKASNFRLVINKCSNCTAELLNTTTCAACFNDDKRFGNSYADMTRTNFNSKYLYLRKQHFYEGFIQFQGRNPIKIEDDLLVRLRAEFAKNSRVNITKYDILKWLKDMNASKYYECIHFLYSTLTNIPCPNLDALEISILADFDTFLVEYSKVLASSPRKNFINVQFILYQLLSRYHFPCKQDDFILPRTIEIKKVYDRLCGEIFKNLRWSYQPFQ